LALHHAAQRGFSQAASTYANGRPEYPAAIVPWLADALGLAPGKKVLDLGAGTGKFTRCLLQTGATVCAVEPVAEMRARLVQDFAAVQTLAGTAQALPLESGSLDAIACAQAFHWFATDAALAEIHRVLRPCGRLGLVWNVRDESVDWVARLTAIITPHEGDAPRYYKGDWREAFRGDLFSPLVLSRLNYQHVGPPDQVVVQRFMSVSFIAALPAPERAAVERQLNDLVAQHPALRGREQVAFPYRTEAFWCQRL
jgi:SAM-dependent methyltransferase